MEGDLSILFLDFDGVLNSHKWSTIRGNVRRGHDELKKIIHKIDPVAIGLLNQLCYRGDLKIVVSSTWRLGGLHFVRAALAAVGCVHDVIGITPQLTWGDGRVRLINLSEEKTPTPLAIVGGVERGLEIQWWIDARETKPSRIVILDDDSDMAHLKPFHVKTDIAVGLTQDNVERALDILKAPFGGGRT